MKKPKPRPKRQQTHKTCISPEPVNDQEPVASVGVAIDQTTTAARIADEQAREATGASSSQPLTRADYSEVAAYEVGVRLQQAIILSKEVAENGSVNLLPDLMNALVRLRTAYDVAITELGPLQGDRDFGRDLLEGALNQIRPLVRGDQNDVEHSGYTCQRFLESFQKSLSARLSGSTVKGSNASPWFELGLEIANGYWYDPCDVPPGGRQKEGDPRWVFDHPDRVDGLLQQLSLSLSDVPPRELSAGPSIWSDDLPQQLVGWERIEDGLQRLRRLQGTNTNAELLPPLNNAQLTIMTALEGRVMTTEEIAALPGIRRRALFDDKNAGKCGDLAELKRQGRVKNLEDDGLVVDGKTTGFYLPDFPPSNMQQSGAAHRRTKNAPSQGH